MPDVQISVGGAGQTDSPADGDRPPAGPTGTNPIARRPAETVTAASAAVIIIAKILGVEIPDDLLPYLVVLVGLIPLVVTWLVELGKRWDRGTTGPRRSGVVGTVDSPSDGCDEAKAELAYTLSRAIRRRRIASTNAVSELEALNELSPYVAACGVAPPTEEGSQTGKQPGAPEQRGTPTDSGAVSETIGDLMDWSITDDDPVVKPVTREEPPREQQARGENS